MIKFLQKPGKVKKYILGGILLIICGAMVASFTPGLMSGSFTGGSPGVLAKVNGEEITLQEAQKTAQQMAKQQFPRGVPSFAMAFFTRQAVDRLVMQKAALAEAERMGLKVTDDDLREYLKKSPVFFPNGQFIGEDAYSRLLQQYELTVAQFEADTKRQILLGMLQNVVQGSATVSDQELQQEFLRQNTKVKFDYAVLTYDDVLKQIKPTEAELRAFFDRNKQSYKNAIPEKRKLQYVVIDAAKMPVQVSQQDLQSYYSQHQDEFRVPEEVTLRQILIKTPAGADQKMIDAARAKAQDVVNKIRAGGNFADLAKKVSEDEATAKNGGLMENPVRRGQTMPEIDKAAFSMNKGQTSDVIQTALGFFIIQVQEKQSAHLKPLDEVKPQIEPIIGRDKARTMAENVATRVQSEARANGLQAAAQKNQLDLVNTDFVTATDSLPGLGTAPEFMQAVFQAKEKNPPELVRTAQNSVVFQVEAIQPPAEPTFEAVRQRVETDFKGERAGAMLAQKIQQLADRAHASHNLRAAAKEVGATVKTSDLVTPQGQVPDIGSMTGPASVAFTMKPGDISNALSTGRNGVVLALLDKQEPPATEFASAKDQIREEVLGQKRNEMMSLFLSNLRQRMEKEKKIVVYDKELEKLVPRGGIGE